RARNTRAVAIECGGAVADMRQPVAHAKGVVVAASNVAASLKAGIEAPIDEAAVVGCTHGPEKNRHRGRAGGVAPHRLVGDAIDAEVGAHIENAKRKFGVATLPQCPRSQAKPVPQQSSPPRRSAGSDG